MTSLQRNSTTRGFYRTPRHYVPRTYRHSEDVQERTRRGLINALRLAIPMWLVIFALIWLTQQLIAWRGV